MKLFLTSLLALVLRSELVYSHEGQRSVRETYLVPQVGVYGIASVRVENVTIAFSLSEGPHWDGDAQVLYFVDIPKQTLNCYDPATNSVTSAYIKNGPLGVAVPIFKEKDTFIAGAGTNLVKIHWDHRQSNPNPYIETITSVDNGRIGTRFNDGKVDPMGRFWAGTMGIKLEPDLGTLYRMDRDFSVTPVLSPVTISNGLAWSLDSRTFYYIDSPTRKVMAYQYDPSTGDIWNPTILMDFNHWGLPGIPDGMTIDNEGNLWIAIYNGGRVISIDSRTGKLLRTVMIPAKQVTSVAFGGRDLNILYVTTARQNLTYGNLKKQPQAGSVFAVHGLPVVGSSHSREYVPRYA